MTLFGTSDGQNENTYLFSSRFDTSLRGWRKLSQQFLFNGTLVDSVTWVDKLDVYSFRLAVNDIKSFIHTLNSYKEYEEGEMITVDIHLRPMTPIEVAYIRGEINAQ